MGEIVSAFGSSHAFTFMEPAGWDDFRQRNRQSFKRRYGTEPPEQQRVETETLEDNNTRYGRIRAAHDDIRTALSKTRPDVLIVIGDDQNELFTAANVPQLALYTGGEFRLSPRFTKTDRVYSSHDALAGTLMTQGVAEGFDIADIGEFPSDELSSHAHSQVIEAFAADATIPVVLVYLNAIHYPAIEPRRCHAFGQMLSRVIEARPKDERVAVCASGGWSHFTAGYPWRVYDGPHTYGAISETFDRSIAECLRRGEGDELTQLSSQDLLENGQIELRAWIAMLGAIGSAPPDTLVYEPFYRAIMGMAVASWTRERLEGTGRC